MSVPFETAEEVEAKLALFEDLFRNKYTEGEKHYEATCKKPEMWYQVPKLYPWPPRHSDRRGHRRGGYNNSERYGRRRGRSDDHHSSWQHHRNRPDYYERSPPSYNRGHRGHELSPPPPHKGHWGHDSSPPPSHSPSRVPRNVRPRSPWQQQQDPSPWRSEGNVQEETTKEKMILDVSLAPPPPPYPGPHPITPTAHEEESTSEGEGGRKNQWKPLDLNEVAGFNEVSEPIVPSKSDVQDILSIASFGSNEVTSENLKKVKEQQQAINKKRKHKEIKKPSALSYLSEAIGHAQQLESKVQVTYGQAREEGVGSKKGVSDSKKHHSQHSAEAVAMDVKSGSGKSHDKGGRSSRGKKKPKKKKREEPKEEVWPNKKWVGSEREWPKGKRKWSERSSEDEDVLVDVTTPQITSDPSLSVSFKKTLMESDGVRNHEFDVADTANAVKKSFLVSIDRRAITPSLTSASSWVCGQGEEGVYPRTDRSPAPLESHSEHAYDNAESANNNEYRVEFSSEPTKLILRTKSEKKKKKKKKKKAKMESLDDDSSDHGHKTGTGMETNTLQYTNPLKVKIKLM